MNIYVGNLSFKVNEDDLRQLFEEFGELNSVKIISDKYSGKSKGFAFIVMDNEEEAKSAIEELNGKDLSDRQIIVNEAKPKKDNFIKKY
jgi:RNA recognition motif-containing protein